MKNLDETTPNGIAPQTGETNATDDDLPASPEEIGATPLQAAVPTTGTTEPTGTDKDSPAGELDESGTPEESGQAEGHDPEESGGADQPISDEQSVPIDVPVSAEEKISHRRSWLVTIIIGLTILFLIAVISAYGGYRSGITARQEAESTQLAGALKQQYQLGVQDLESGNYYRARQRFEYVIGLDPLYPGAAEGLSAVLFELNTTATPTLVPTPTLTPTPDMRDVQDIFDQGQEYLRNGEWDNAIETLLTLRKTNPEFSMVQVDGMLFIALRNRGKDKILLEQDLEGGIYDLTLAKRFGILDAEADGLLNWSQLYITGASFWEIDWGQASYYFSQVAPHLPNLMDKSGYTAGERYRLSTIEYGYYLAEQKKWCQSFEQLQLALSIAYDAQVEQDMNTVAERCAKGEEPTK